MGNKVVICGIDTSVLPSLNHSRSVELLNEIKNGNEESRNYFINCNLRLVLSIVNRYSSRTKELDDIFQMGCVGLIKSIDNFNVCLEVDNVATIKTLVKKDLGVSILPKSACISDARKGKISIVPIENLTMMREMNVAYGKDFNHPDLLRDIVRIYQSAVSKN